MTGIERAAEIIRRGGLVAFPTETVYGLGANALDPSAIARIYAAKGRPPTSPLIVHVASVAMAQTLVSEWPRCAELLALKFWPGPLTLVLRKASIVPGEVTAQLDTVGVRVPAHPVALALIEAAGVPIAAPSANRFTELSPTTAEHVRAGLGDLVDFILDGGPTQVGIESTVVSLVSGYSLLLRPGIISREQIEDVIGPVAQSSEVTTGAHPSPGMHSRHYSPRKPVVLTALPPRQAGYIWWSTEQPSALSLKLPSEPEGYARQLYAALHKLDKSDVSLIAIEPVPEGEGWEGIRDRLNRAQHQ